VQQLQADIRGLNGSISEKLAHVAQLSLDAAALSAENGNLRTQVQQFRSEQEQSQREILRTRDAAQHSEGQRQALERQVQELKLTLAEHRDRAAADSQRIRDLELAAAREGVQREQARDKIEVLQAELDWITNLASVAGISGSVKKLQGLSPESAARLARLRVEARRVMEREGTAELWLHQRNAALGSVSPAELVDSDAGFEEAVQLLTRIEHGVPT
jgi:putative toxin-antitoxin system antitoxin component (TIGR02293 family)